MLLTSECAVHGRRLMTRRLSLRSLGAAALSMAYLQSAAEVSGQESLDPGEQIARWQSRLFTNAEQLRQREISGLQWQEVMDQIYRDVSVGQLKERLHFDELRLKLLETISAETPEVFHRIELPGIAESKEAESGEPNCVLITKLAYVRKGRSVPPHGHSDMVSAFLCLSGEFDVRQYDRLEDREDCMIIRQSSQEQSAGDVVQYFRLSEQCSLVDCEE